MERFARLFAAIDGTNATLAKVSAIRHYLTEAPPGDAAWGVFFLTGRRLTRLMLYAMVHRVAQVLGGIDDWLLQECYSVVGDGAETAALVLDALPRTDARDRKNLSLATWVEERILPLRGLTPDAQQAAVTAWVRPLDRSQRLVLFKLLTGELRLGVSQTLVVRAIAESAGLPATAIAARLMGAWAPSAGWLSALVSPEATDADRSRPYPFALAAPLDPGVTPAEVLGARDDWQVEWKWDGIRAQLVRRGGRVYLWSRGEELMSDRFPEIVDAAFPIADGTVLDGEILAFRGERPLPFAALQHRIGRTRQVARTARDVPIALLVYDLLEWESADVRSWPLHARRAQLETVVPEEGLRMRVTRPEPPAGPALLPFEEGDEDGAVVIRRSPVLGGDDWAEVAAARSGVREHGVEGVMLKRLTSPYGVGRRRGDWWKWKIDPFTIDAVLIYAQPGSGKRASLLTDYTFGLWDGDELVPVAKAYSGLSNEEIAELDRWIRRHTVERFGPVRHVEPVHVFELGFEAIARSTRHRSGVAVRFPRMLRWRTDKPAREADALQTLQAMVPSQP
jgi:DNA ligase-1